MLVNKTRRYIVIAHINKLQEVKQNKNLTLCIKLNRYNTLVVTRSPQSHTFKFMHCFQSLLDMSMMNDLTKSSVEKFLNTQTTNYTYYCNSKKYTQHN